MTEAAEERILWCNRHTPLGTSSLLPSEQRTGPALGPEKAKQVRALLPSCQGTGGNALLTPQIWQGGTVQQILARFLHSTPHVLRNVPSSAWVGVAGRKGNY